MARNKALPDGWQVRTISELGKFDKETVQTGPFGAQLHAKDYVKDGVPLILIRNLNGNKINPSDMPRITQEDAERLSLYTLKKDDVVFSRVGRVGSCYLITEEQEGWIISGQMLRIRLPKDAINREYLIYALRSSEAQAQITGASVGSTRQSINTKILSSLKIPLPPLEQQRKIAAILSSLDDAIEKTQAVIDQLKRVKHGLMQQLFTRGIPGWHRQFKDSKLGTIPQSWEIKQLKHLGKIITGSTPPTKNKEMYGDYIPFVGPANIQNAPKVTILEGNKYISEKGAEVTQITFGPTVLVVCIGSTIGKVAFTRETVAFNQQINSFVPYNGSSLFYFYYLQIRAEAIRRLSGKHAVPIVNRSSFSTLRCAVPSIREQEEISKVLITIDQSIEAEQTEKSQLTVLKKGLMQGLLSGRMGVSG